MSAADSAAKAAGGTGAPARFGSGHAIRRIEDPALVTGRGAFTDDFSLEKQVHLCFLRSPHAHARIASIDANTALAVPGVVAVLTGDDLVAAGVGTFPGPGFTRPDGSPGISPPRRPLAVERVRYVGEAVAAIVAETREGARAARDAVLVEYEPYPAVVDPVEAQAPGAPLVFDDAPGNLAAAAQYGDAAAAEAAFRKAAHVVPLDLENQRVAPSPMEPRAVLAEFDADSGRLTVRMSTQMPAGARDTLANEILGIEPQSVRVLAGDVGGGFGMKTGLYPEDAVVAFAARHLRRPVKWCAERSDEFLGAGHGRDLLTHAELALDADGRILALRVRSVANVGAYCTPTGAIIPLLIGPWVLTSVYHVPVVDFDFRAILTNRTPVGAYRGAGRPESIYIIERLMDAAARITGLEQPEIRRRNMIRPEQMPYTNPMGQTYDNGRFESVMDQALALADWRGFDARLAESKTRGRLRGRGIATYLEWTGGNAFEERVTVDVAADGFIEIVSATQAMGQGLATTYAQLAVDLFQVPIERIRIRQGDTDLATGFGSAASRSVFTGGSAVQVASKRTLDHARELAADDLEASPVDIEYADGRFRIAGTDRTVGLFELAAHQPEQRIYLESTSAVQGATWPNACHISEVEIDPDTGETTVVAYSSVNDVGRVVNPTIVRGQLDGGAVQGIGQALSEAIVYDRESGQLQSASFLDYAMPRAGIVRRFRTELDESLPSALNPLGAKGVGELGTIGATPCVVNAVVDALWRAGCGERALTTQMPMTPERVWSALQARP